MEFDLKGIIAVMEDALRQLLNLGPEALVGLALIAVGYVLRFIPAFPNKFIPAVVIVGPALVYPLLSDAGQVPNFAGYPVVRQALVGLLIGLLTWVLHNKVLARWLDPILFPKDQP